MIVVINSFEVPAENREAFLGAWKAVSAVMESRPGFIHTRLHRCTSAPAFVNVAEWESMEALASALSSVQFREAAMPLRKLGSEHPALYEVVYEAGRV